MRRAPAQRKGAADDMIVIAHQHVGALNRARGRNTALDVCLRFLSIAMRSPNHIAGDLFILGIGIEDRVGIPDRNRPQQEASGPEGVW